jgi:integral membrane sensor domain MASE1
MPRSRLVRTAVSSVLLAVVYFIAARVGLMLATVGHSVSLVWPPTGLALGVLLMHGRSLWPGLALGAFVVNATTEGVPVLAAAGIALGNTSEALVGTWLLERSGFDPSLRRVTDVLRLMVVAAVASPPVSAALGTLSLWLGGVLPTGQVPLALRAWWVGDAMGARGWPGSWRRPSSGGCWSGSASSSSSGLPRWEP